MLRLQATLCRPHMYPGNRWTDIDELDKEAIDVMVEVAMQQMTPQNQTLENQIETGIMLADMREKERMRKWQALKTG